MSNNLSLLVKTTFIILDLLILNSIVIMMEWNADLNSGGQTSATDLLLSVICNSTWLICAWMNKLYEKKSIKSFAHFIAQTVRTFCVFALTTLALFYLFDELSLSPKGVSMLLITLFIGISINRLLYLATWLHFRNKDYLMRRILIIGYNESSKRLALHFENSNPQTTVIGFCEDHNNMQELSHYPIINTPLNAIEAYKQLRVTDIYSTILPEQDERIYDLMHLADQECIRFKLVPDFGSMVKRPMHLNYVSGFPILSARKEPLEDIANRIRKRIFDIAVSAFVIIFILSWLVPIIALAIWLNSKGPIFFVQQRTGLNNKSFSCYKFRSMKINQRANSLQAQRNDDRLTSVGKFLRKTNLDEFPQFFNVLKGDMSIVGPRPHMLKHTKDYSGVIRKYMVRQFLKPGITGWAQVNGHRGETRRIEDMQKRIDHDLWYMENWSFYLDARIIFLTAFNTIKGDDNAF